jgi:hypothetical protein
MKFIKSKKFSILANILKYSFVFMIAFTLVMPLVVDAKCPENPADCNNGGDMNNGGSMNNGGDMNNGGSKSVTGISFAIKNPIKVDTIGQFIEIILNAVLVIGVPIVALAIVYCGFLFVKARGNGEEIKKAKGAFMYTIVGAFLLLGAWVLAKAIGVTVNEIISTT